MIRSLDSDVLRFTARFDSSAIYVPDPEGDLNKLLGFTDCNSTVHDNSARFAWRWHEDCIEIHAYVYRDGERFTEHIADIDLNKDYEYFLTANKDFYTFQVGKFGVLVPRTPPCRRGVYMMLWPYFGGQAVAPHDITIAVTFHYQ